MGKSSDEQNVLKGALYGGLAGAAASYAMDNYWLVARKVMGDRPEQKPKGNKEQKAEPSTQVVADKISETVTGHEVTKRDKPAAGVGVHYATGVGLGMPFGAIMAKQTGMGLFAGLAYGAGVWLVLDEVVLRTLKIGPKADDVPISQHMQAVGAHLVYGASTALITRLLLRIL